MEPMQSYSLERFVLIIGDRDIAGGGEDGFYEEEPAADVFEPQVMVNGFALINENLDNSVIATVTVSSHSRAARELDEILEEQREEARTGGIEAREFLARDPSSGGETRDRFCVVLNKPGMVRSNTSGDYQYRIFLPNGAAPGNSPRAADIT